MSAPIIRAVGLTKRFGDFTAVDQLSIEVPSGSIFAFLGANGSGKSTTIRMLIGLLEPTEGSVEVDGIDVIANPRRVRDHIGYMGQKVSLYQGLTLRENVEFYAGLQSLAGKDLAARWGGLRERFQLGDAENEKAEDLAAGIRQRAGLAVSMLHQPRVLFLDEPTAGVDVSNRGLFWELIQEEADSGVTVFVTTHFLEEVDYCDWVAFIDAGRLIADAAPAALRERYSEGYRVDVELPAGDAGALQQDAARFERNDGGLRAWFPQLTTADLENLDALYGTRGVRAQITQAPMTDIFRRVLAEAQRNA
jgi:ABC-2 type transport system ATP-binding protein